MERKKEIVEVERIIKAAVHETLVSLGFTLEEPNEIQKDMAFLRKSREGSDDVAKWVKRSAISVFFTGLVTILVLGLKTFFGDKGV